MDRYDDIDLQLIGYMYTYLMYTYIHTVRSGKVGTVHIHPHISAGTRQQNRKSFLTVVYIPESPVPMKSTRDVKITDQPYLVFSFFNFNSLLA